MHLALGGKSAIVTGGSDGIGLEVALAFAAEGCNVGICGRTKEKLEKALERLRATGVKAMGATTDVTSGEQAARFLDACESSLGRIDILVNNVGGSVGGSLMASSDDDWAETFELNVIQTIRMIRIVAPRMRAVGGGSIVNISSISGWQPQLCGTLQYGAAKAALIYLTEPLALELAASGIRLNTVSPGSILCEGGGWHRYRSLNPEQFARHVENAYPYGRLGTTEEVAAAVVFLASSRASWISGRNLGVDGLQQPVPAEGKQLW